VTKEEDAGMQWLPRLLVQSQWLAVAVAPSVFAFPVVLAFPFFVPSRPSSPRRVLGCCIFTLSTAEATTIMRARCAALSSGVAEESGQLLRGD
jgi:hypothetical protein